MKLLHVRKLKATAAREMAAFDQLPPELRAWVRTANLGWECTKMLRRLRGAKDRKAARWGEKRLLEQYRAEDALPSLQEEEIA